ncbi:MAG: hypothetical protein WBV74_11110, partial [Pseudonocardiaceae bacterium]
DEVPTASGPAAAPPARRVGVELRVALSTLLGRDRYPGEVAGWGPVTAEVARTVVIAQRAAQWRFAITDPAGRLLLAGTTRRRPHSTASCGELPPCRGGIVELQLPAALLTELATDPHACGQWTAVVADLSAQYTRHTQGHCTKPPAKKPAARFAGAALRRHDHRLKHPGRWRLHQPTPGHFTWTSPLGRTYHTQPPPIINDLPEPRPRPDYPDRWPFARANDDSPILDRPPAQPDPPPPATPSDPDEPPPF